MKPGVDEKKQTKLFNGLDLLMAISLALPIAGISVTATYPLAKLVVWGSLTIPETATMEELMYCWIWQLPLFSFMTLVPKFIIYRKTSERGGKKRWAFLTYAILPFVVMLAFPFFDTTVIWIWAAIATVAWTEVGIYLIKEARAKAPSPKR